MRLLLFSGGLDSTALAYWLKPEQLVFLNYGQLSAGGELRAATQIARELELPLRALAVDCKSVGSGEMVGLPSLSTVASEFWPYRNQLLVTLAAMSFAGVSPLTILIGSVRTDRIHTDGRPEFLTRISDLLSVQGDTRVEAPALALTSESLIKKSAVPRDLLAWSFSCHRGSYACGQCRGCIKHFETLAKVADDGSRHEVNS